MIQWAKNHLKHILYGVLGLVVVLGLVLGWSGWQKQRRQKAALLLHQALVLLKTDGTPSATPVDKAVAQLQAITRDYGSTPAAALAYWHLGHRHFADGDYPAALTAYEQAQRLLPRDSQRLSTALVTLNVGHAQEAVGACDKAIATYEAVQQSAAPWLYGEAYLGMGRCYAHSGATDQAIAVYQRALAESHVTGAARQTISERLAQLQPLEAVPAPMDKDGAANPAADPPAALSTQEGSGAEPTTEPTSAVKP